MDQKVSNRNNIWPDVVFGAMIFVSVVGLIYMVLQR